MQVHVRLFAVARQIVGSNSIIVDVPSPAAVSDLRRAIGQGWPALASLLPSMMIAVGSEYADDARPITEGCELAVIPPVSGGCDG